MPAFLAHELIDVRDERRLLGSSRALHSQDQETRPLSACRDIGEGLTDKEVVPDLQQTETLRSHEAVLTHGTFGRLLATAGARVIQLNARLSW